MRFRSLVPASILLLPAVTLAGAPYQTDDPVPVDYHHHEFFLAWAQTRAGGAVSGNLPQLTISYGVAPGVQVGATLPYAYRLTSQGDRSLGVGDTVFALKVRLQDEAGDRPMIGVGPQVQTASGNAGRGLGTGAIQFLLPVWLEKNSGAWTLNGGGGYCLSEAPAQRSHWIAGVQLQKRMDHQWTPGVELVHSTELIRGQGSSTGFNLGVVKDMGTHDHLMLSLGRGLVHEAATNQGTLFLAWQRTW